MTPNDLSNRVGSITDKAVERLSAAVTKTQKMLFDDVSALLSKLELDSDGLVKQNAANRKVLTKLDGVFNKSIRESGYYESLDDYTDNIIRLTSANDQYFNFILDSFTVDAHYIKSLQKQSIAEIEGLLANDGLTVALKDPLKQILNTNVNTGASFSDMLTQVRGFIQGTPDAEGKLLRYSKQITRDSLFNYSSSLQESVSQSAGLQFYYYQGHLMTDSRPFCIERKGKYYHKNEVESWASMDWQGKRTGTTSSTIFIYRGGYNCLHQIIPVSEAVVPKEVIERAKDKGFYV